MCTILEAISVGLNTAVGIANTINYANKSAKESNMVIENQIKLAKRAEADAAYERQEGIEDSRKERLKAIRNMAEVQSNIASNGISTNSSTSLLLFEDEEEKGELNALDVIDDSERNAKKYMEVYDDYYSKAKLTSLTAKNKYAKTIREGFFKAGKTLLKGGVDYAKEK